MKKTEFFNANQSLIEKIPGKVRILVAPLDWGLGHATRCIPIINNLLIQGCEVILASDGSCAELLRTEFPQLTMLLLDGYNIRYSRSGKNLAFVLTWQARKIRRAITKENRWLKKTVEMYNIDAVVSDNRFGLYHDKIPSVFITHQLYIKSPFGKWSEKILQKWNYNYINRFSECWVPDFEEDHNLAGQLSHPSKKPGIPLRYLGPLSRFNGQNWAEEKSRLLILLSGPEPQRSIFEDKLIDQLAHYNGTASVVRGLPADATVIPSSNQLRFYNHLSSTELNSKMQEALLVVSRSGYSTIMDLVQLQKKSVLVPTPGQTEQEYLAEYLEKKQIACRMRQDDFCLIKAVEKAERFSYCFTGMQKETNLEKIIENFADFLLVKQNRDEGKRIESNR